jgi:hypothetical protein
LKTDKSALPKNELLALPYQTAGRTSKRDGVYLIHLISEINHGYGMGLSKFLGMFREESNVHVFNHPT